MGCQGGPSRRKLSLEGKYADEEAIKKIDKEIRDIVNESAKFAQESPEPDLAELYTDILAEA